MTEITEPDLKVTRFTPQAEKALGLRSADQGKPIGHIRLTIDSAALEEKCMHVMRNLASRQFSIRDHDGRVRVVRIAPCRTTEIRSLAWCSCCRTELREHHSDRQAQHCPA